MIQDLSNSSNSLPDVDVSVRHVHVNDPIWTAGAIQAQLKRMKNRVPMQLPLPNRLEKALGYTYIRVRVGEQTVARGVSLCCVKDHFSRKKGIKEAIENAEENYFAAKELGFPLNHLTEDQVNDVVSLVHQKRMEKKAAKEKSALQAAVLGAVKAALGATP